MESKLKEYGPINHLLHQSMDMRVPVKISLLDSLEELCIIGIIDNISIKFGRFMVGDDWFLIDDIDEISLLEPFRCRNRKEKCS